MSYKRNWNFRPVSSAWLYVAADVCDRELFSCDIRNVLLRTSRPQQTNCLDNRFANKCMWNNTWKTYSSSSLPNRICAVVVFQPDTTGHITGWEYPRTTVVPPPLSALRWHACTTAQQTYVHILTLETKDSVTTSMMQPLQAMLSRHL